MSHLHDFSTEPPIPATEQLPPVDFRPYKVLHVPSNVTVTSRTLGHIASELTKAGLELLAHGDEEEVFDRGELLATRVGDGEPTEAMIQQARTRFFVHLVKLAHAKPRR